MIFLSFSDDLKYSEIFAYIIAGLLDLDEYNYVKEKAPYMLDETDAIVWGKKLLKRSAHGICTAKIIAMNC